MSSLISTGGACESDDGLGVGEDADDVGAPLDLAVEAFDRIVRPDLGPVHGRERGVGEQVVRHVRETACDLGCERFELADDVVELGACPVVVGLGEHGPDECRDELAVLVPCGGRGSRIAWTRQRCQALPCRTLPIAAVRPR